MQPIICKPIYKDLIWGGTRMAEKYGRVLPGESIGESWDVSCRDLEMSVVDNGAWAGQTLGVLIEADRAGMLGANLAHTKNFPLLVKIIDAKDNLSVQVHPGDTYAREVENLPYGKTEMWYILDAPKGAELIIGLRDGITREDFGKAVADGAVEECLGRLPIAAGDVIFIAAGLVHAITAGVMLAEIQQNSDTTYRMYDYNRLGFDGKPRDLHIDKSMDVTDFAGVLRKEAVPGITVGRDAYDLTYYIACPYFAAQTLALRGKADFVVNPARFEMLTCTEGETVITAEGGVLRLAAGQTVFLPAALGAYTLEGSAVLLKSFVPDIETEHILPLQAAGHTMEGIQEKTAVVLS